MKNERAEYDHVNMSNQWRKSSWSANEGNCVEVRRNPDNSIEMRDSKAPYPNSLNFSADAWTDFLTCIKSGQLDS
jgi:Domain of unknown function (DUF397)